jgi:hypothetical protein
MISLAKLPSTDTTTSRTRKGAIRPAARILLKSRPMTPKQRQRMAAFTRKDLSVMLAMVVALGIVLIPSTRRATRKSHTINCIRNLKELGTAYALWANAHGDRYPAVTSLTNGGWSEILNRPSASTWVWTNYAIMSYGLGQTSSILACPDDERKPAELFSNIIANTNISYFVGICTNDKYPQSILGGDRNLGPGTTPDPQYGYSPSDGRGNDVVIKGPVSWSLKMHSHGDSAGRGNILIGDGSAQQTTSRSLTSYWLPTNTSGVRLIFP